MEQAAEVQKPERPPTIEERISAVMRQDEAPEAVVDTQNEAVEESDAVSIDADPEEAPRAPDDLEREQPDDDAESIEIADITGLAEYLGVDAADVYNIAVPYTKDGERHEFTLGEIKDKLGDFQETLAMREQADATYQRYQQAETQIKEALEQQSYMAASILQQAEQALLADMQGINWAALERTNPGERARLSEQARRRQAEIRQIGHQAAQQFEQQKTQVTEQLQKIKQEKLMREQSATLRAIPEWRDEAKANTERRQLAEYMQKTGFTADEINGIDDHRQLLLARKAWMYDQLKDSGSVASKKVVKLAKKIVKPGARRTAAEQSADQSRGLIQAHRSNPKSMEAAAARIAQKLKLGR